MRHKKSSSKGFTKCHAKYVIVAEEYLETLRNLLGSFCRMPFKMVPLNSHVLEFMPLYSLLICGLELVTCF